MKGACLDFRLPDNVFRKIDRKIFNYVMTIKVYLWLVFANRIVGTDLGLVIK